jgi:hypothetical protein
VTAQKKIVLHIGHGKTGSSAIQSALARNHDLLKTAGILYPEGKASDPARRGEVTSGNVDLENWFEGQVVPIARAADGYRTILFSNENLFHAFDAFLERHRDYESEFAFEILLFVREPFEKLNSAFQQAVKRRGFAGGIDEFAMADTDADRAASILRTLDARRVPFRLFNYSALRRSAVQAVFEHLGVWDLIRAGGDPEVGTVNRSLTAAELSFLLHVNHLFGVEFGSVIADALVHRLPDLAPDMAPIDAETRRRFHEANIEAVQAINVFLPASEQLLLDSDAMPIESDGAKQRLSEAQAEVIRSVFPSALSYKDGVVLRDIAMKYESGEALTREEGIALMQFAQKARPHGRIIAGKLKEWREG